MSSRSLAKTSSMHVQDILQRYLQEIFKTYHQVKLFLLTRLREVFNKFLRRTPKTIIYSRICLGHTTSEKLWSVYKICKRQKKFLKLQVCISLQLLVAAYRGIFRTRSNIYKDVFLHKYMTSKNDVMRNSAEFTRKDLCQNLFFFDNVKLCRSAASLKMRPQRRCFLVNFAKFVRIPFFAKHHQTTASDYSSIRS